MRMSLKVEDGFVALSYDAEDWQDYPGKTVRVTRHFTCPSDGGYVRDEDGKQVCDGLSHTGPTLMCSSFDRLPALIRQEYRAMRRAEKRYAF